MARSMATVPCLITAKTQSRSGVSVVGGSSVNEVVATKKKERVNREC